MKDKTILLVEDNPDDVALTLRSLKKNNIFNEVVVAKDGVEALDYLFGTGMYAGREVKKMPVVILLAGTNSPNACPWSSSPPRRRNRTSSGATISAPTAISASP